MRRVICGLLSVLMLVGALAVGAVNVSAASGMTTSDKAIKILKRMEGFSQYAYKDNSQYSIGYGCACNPADYPNGITEEAADALMRENLVAMENSVNKFADRYNLNFTQNQFDALMLFTYNNGAGWTSTDSDFRTSVINGDNGNDFIYYITRWCTASGSVSLGLVDRRLAEADLYLYGYYNLNAPSNYAYALFDTNGGTCDSRIQGYDACVPVEVRAVPVYTGYRFLGWYTAAEGGEWITDLDATTMDITLYAHWQRDEGNVAEDGTILGDAVSYQRKAGDVALSVYETPCAEGEAIGTVDKDQTVSIVADYIDAEGAKWGKLAEGGWVILNDTTVDVVAAEKPERIVEEEPEEDASVSGIAVKVTGTNVNIRSGAGTNNTKVGTANYGQTLTITETAEVGGTKWGKCSQGWICLMYTNYDAVIADMNAASGNAIATGIVKNCGSLRVRAGAGTSYEVVGSLAAGTEVQIYQKQDVSGTPWGRISNGWICLSYVQLKEADANQNQTTEPPETDKEETNTENSGTSSQLMGTVISNTSLNIRKGPGTSYGVVGSYARGTKVTILEQQTVSGTPWGRTDKGWISLYYVNLDSTNTNTGNNTNTGSSTVTLTGTVGCSSYLNVRSGPGTSYDPVTAVANGDKVEIYETVVTGTITWGRIDKGWISLNYVKLDSAIADNTGDTGTSDTNTGSTGSDNGNTGVIATGKVVNANSLRVRSGAGTNYSVVDGLTMGESVAIYEMKTVSGLVWGRISTGWISLNYVKLDSASGNVVVMTGTVTANGLRIRSAAGTQNAIVGSYDKGARVEIYETATVGGQSWGRTDKGWICLSYVQ